MIVASVDLLLYPLFSDTLALMGMSFILGLALGACQPSMLAMLYQYSPPGRQAEAGGIRMAMVNASQVALPLVCSTLDTVVGIMPLFWAYALILSGGVLMNRKSPNDT